MQRPNKARERLSCYYTRLIIDRRAEGHPKRKPTRKSPPKKDESIIRASSLPNALPSKGAKEAFILIVYALYDKNVHPLLRKKDYA